MSACSTLATAFGPSLRHVNNYRRDAITVTCAIVSSRSRRRPWNTDSMFRRYAILDRSDLLAALQRETEFKRELAERRKAEAEQTN